MNNHANSSQPVALDIKKTDYDEWLLLGGPLDGQTVSVAAAAESMLALDSDGKVVEYRGRICVYNGLVYIFGVCVDYHPPEGRLVHAIKQLHVKPVKRYSGWAETA